MTNTTKKVTKKDYLNTILDILDNAEANGVALPENINYEGLKDFASHEIELLDSKAASAQKRAAAKKVEGDALRDKIYNVLSDADYMIIRDITAALDDPDVSDQMVTARLGQMIKLDPPMVEKTTAIVQSAVEGGKTKKLSAYRRV